MKTKITFFMVLLAIGLFIFPASASDNKQECLVMIKDVSIKPIQGTVPLEVEMSGTITGDVDSITYKVINQDSGRVECSSTLGITKCSKYATSGTCKINNAGIYDVIIEVTDKGGCTVIKTINSAITVTDTSGPEINSTESTYKNCKDKKIIEDNITEDVIEDNVTFEDNINVTEETPTEDVTAPSCPYKKVQQPIKLSCMKCPKENVIEETPIEENVFEENNLMDGEYYPDQIKSQPRCGCGK